MKKHRYFKVILISVVVFFVVVAGSVFFNFDHLTSGQLKKVGVVLKNPLTGSDNILVTVTDNQDLMEMTSIFFGKFNESILFDTAEDSFLSVVFTFEKKTITFKLFSDSVQGNQEYTYFKYPDRKMRFSIPSSQRKGLLELIP